MYVYILNKAYMCVFMCIYHCNSVPAGEYEAQTRSSQKMMRAFGFASSLIEVLALGLKTYYGARYRQLVKLIGRMIRQDKTREIEAYLHCAT